MEDLYIFKFFFLSGKNIIFNIVFKLKGFTYPTKLALYHDRQRLRQSQRGWYFAFTSLTNTDHKFELALSYRQQWSWLCQGP